MVVQSEGGNGLVPAGTRLCVWVHTNDPEPVGIDPTAIFKQSTGHMH